MAIIKNSINKLNVGCGLDIRKGWTNMDIAPLPGVDVVHDIEKFPFPFEDNTFDLILCQDVLEHVDYIPVLKELHRISKKGGVLSIRVPHFSSKNNYIDPTHKKMFSWRTFEFFTEKSFLGRAYYFDFTFDHISNSQITFLKKKRYAYNYIMSFFVNGKTGFKDIYEDTFLCRIFPALNIEIDIVK